METPMPDFALAFDIGGSKMASAIIDAEGKALRALQSQPVPFDPQPSEPGGRAASAERLLDLMAPHVAQARSLPGAFHGIGISLCGNVDTQSGEAVLVPNLHWRYVPFGQMVRDRFGLPIAPGTDVRMAALGEAVWGVAKNVRHMAWGTIGTGYGGYMILDGKLYGGAHGFAGNFGHMTLDEVNGYPCGCGRRGCFETFVAGPAIARAGQAAADQGRSPLLVELAAGQPVTTRLVFQAESAGDPAAVEILDKVVRLISINLGGLVNMLDLEMIVLGGGVVDGKPELVQRIHRRIRDFLMTAEAQRDLQVVRESLPNSPLWGAAADTLIRAGVIKNFAVGMEE